MNIHVARVAFKRVDPTGNVLDGADPGVTIKQMMQTSSDHRIVADANIPNTANNPTIKAYLELEAAGSYVLQHMDQSFVITYQRTAGGGFA